MPGTKVPHADISGSGPKQNSALQVHVFGAGLGGGRRQPLQQRGVPAKQQGFNHYDNGRGLWVRPNFPSSLCGHLCSSLRPQALDVLGYACAQCCAQ